MPETRRPAILSSLAAFVAVCLGSEALAGPPNILFIFADDHATSAISAYDSKINETPNIDRIANEGMRLDRYYITNALCGPSRACILTGKYSHINGFKANGDRFDSSQTTVVTRLQDAGYQTAVVGKWHLVTDPVGFDHWDILPGQGRYYKPDFYSPRGKTVEDGYVSDIIVDKALDWLDADRREDRPFMLMVQHKAPHRAWHPGPEHVGDYQGEPIPEPATLLDDYKNRSDAPSRATMRIGSHMDPAGDLMIFRRDSQMGNHMKGKMSPEAMEAWYESFSDKNEEYLADPPKGDARTKWHYQRYIKNYLRCVASVDDGVGRLLDWLDENDLADDTIVIYSSDQGFFLGEHGWYDKRFMYEPSLRTPFVIRWPGVVKKGSTDDHITSNVDLAPTFLEAAGLSRTDDLQGRSLVPILEGKEVKDWRESFYYQFYEGPPAVHTVDEHYGVTDGRYKLIHFYEIDQWEMYDLEEDPEEMNSVYDDPKYADTQSRLEKELKHLRTELKVPQ